MLFEMKPGSIRVLVYQNDYRVVEVIEEVYYDEDGFPDGYSSHFFPYDEDDPPKLS